MFYRQVSLICLTSKFFIVVNLFFHQSFAFLQVEIDGLFIFYADNEAKHMIPRRWDMKFPPEKLFMHCKSGKRLDDLCRTMYEDKFDWTTRDGLQRYDGLKLT